MKRNDRWLFSVLILLLCVWWASECRAQIPSVIQVFSSPLGQPCTPQSPIALWVDGTTLRHYMCQSSSYVEAPSGGVPTVARTDTDPQNQTCIAGSSPILLYEGPSGGVAAHTCVGTVYVRQAIRLTAYTDTGAGTSGSPWTIQTSVWDEITGNRIEVPNGVYEIAAAQTLELKAGTELDCAPGATFQWPASRPTQLPMFRVTDGASDVRLHGCTFAPGITVPDAGDPTGGGSYYLQVGTGAQPVTNLQVIANRFEDARVTANPYNGGHILVSSGLLDPLFEANTFGRTCISIEHPTGGASAQVSWNVRFNHNVWGTQRPTLAACSNFLLAWGNKSVAPATWNEVYNFSAVGNLFENVQKTIAVATTFQNVLISSNIYRESQYMADVQSNASNPVRGRFVTFSGNQSTGDGHGEAAIQFADYAVFSGNLWYQDADNQITVKNATHVTIVGNTSDERQTTISTTQPYNLQNVSDVVIVGNQMSNCGNECVSLEGTVERITVGMNLWTNTTGSTNTGTPIRLDGPCTDCSLLDNRYAGAALNDAGSGIGTLINWQHATGNLLTGVADELAELRAQRGYRITGPSGAVGDPLYFDLYLDDVQRDGSSKAVELHNAPTGPGQELYADDDLDGDGKLELRFRPAEALEAVGDYGMAEQSSDGGTGEITDGSNAEDLDPGTAAVFNFDDQQPHTHVWEVTTTRTGYPFAWLSMKRTGPTSRCRDPANTILEAWYCIGASCDPFTGTLIGRRTGEEMRAGGGGDLEPILFKDEQQVAAATVVRIGARVLDQHNLTCNPSVHSVGVEWQGDKLDPVRKQHSGYRASQCMETGNGRHSLCSDDQVPPLCSPGDMIQLSAYPWQAVCDDQNRWTTGRNRFFISVPNPSNGTQATVSFTDLPRTLLRVAAVQVGGNNVTFSTQTKVTRDAVGAVQHTAGLTVTSTGALQDATIIAPQVDADRYFIINVTGQGGSPDELLVLIEAVPTVQP